MALLKLCDFDEGKFVDRAAGCLGDEQLNGLMMCGGCGGVPDVWLIRCVRVRDVLWA